MGPQERNEDGSKEEPQQYEQSESGHTGEGAASAMAHIANQDKRNRHQPGDANDASGNASRQ